MKIYLEIMPLSRLQKIISGSGLLSRRKAELFIKQSRVTLKGRQALIGEKADPQSDQILVDGKITMPAAIEVMKSTNNKTLLKVIRKEGRNRKIPRIANLLGHPVQDLQRIEISKIKLNGLKESKRRGLKISEWISLID